MRLITFAIFALMIPAASRSAENKSEPPNSCVNCHQTLIPRWTPPFHSVEDWATSPHAKPGVRCEACHGGNPRETSAEKAHVGVFPRNDPRSTIFYSNIPKTCGACHSTEYTAFLNSKHFEVLIKSGLGPNCVTCHGDTATRILSAGEVGNTCSLCHRTSIGASFALKALDDASESLRKLTRLIEEKRTRGIDVSASEDALRNASSVELKTIMLWHQFDIQAVIKGAEEVGKKASESIFKLEHPNTRPVQRGQ